MPSSTANNEAFLYIQAQSASAGVGSTGALSDNNGVRLKLHGDDGIFSIETGDSERLRVTEDGDVGIGTIDPTGTNALTNNNSTLAVGIVTANTIYGNVVGGIAPTGNVDIGGNLDVDGQTDLDVLNVAETATFSSLLRADGALSVTGNIDLTGELNFNGNNHKFIDFETLDNNKRFDLRHRNASSHETAISCIANDAVKLFFNGDEKFQTLERGVSIGGSITVSNDLKVSGVSTFVGNAEFGGNVSIAGTLTYEDVTNVDAIGIITARSSIHVGMGISVVGLSTFKNTVEFQDKVGINTANPQVHDLHVNGNAFVDGNLLLRDRSDSEVKLNGQDGNLHIHSDGYVRLVESDADKEMIRFDINTTHNDGRMSFEGDLDTFLNHPGDNRLGIAAGGSEIIKITSDTVGIGSTVSNMKVGVGTDNPLNLLDVHQSSGRQRFNKYGHYISKNDTASTTEYWTFAPRTSGSLGIGRGVPDAEGTVFSSNDKLTIKSTGEVGIGSQNPAYTLDFGKSTASTIRLISEDDGTAIRIGPGAANNDVTLLRVDGRTEAHMGESDNSSYGFSLKYMGSRTGNNNSFSLFADNSEGTQFEAITVLQDGKIGIKDTSPSYELEVNGTVAATNFDSLSDRKVKTNIKIIQDPIDKIKKIDGVSFNWKSDNRPSLGVIADNVEEILPEIVSGNDPKSVNYNGLIGLLIEVVKDQQKQIDELRGLLDK